MNVKKFALTDAPFERAPDQDGDIWLGNVVDQQDGGPITTGYGRYAPHQTNSETLAFDEVMVILSGHLTVRSDSGDVTAGPGEIVYMPRGATVTYVTHDDGAAFAYVTYPHWQTS